MLVGRCEKWARALTFVDFTTSVLSASYIGHGPEIGRLTPWYLRFYHIQMSATNLGPHANTSA
jgi:hypothetical protein